MTYAFDYARFFATVDAIREHQGIESIPKLAAQLGIPQGALYDLRAGKPCTWPNMLQLIGWARVDVRSYVRSQLVAVPIDSPSNTAPYATFVTVASGELPLGEA